jgi:hypothetical protein
MIVIIIMSSFIPGKKAGQVKMLMPTELWKEPKKQLLCLPNTPCDLIEARNKLSFGAPERFCTIYT